MKLVFLAGVLWTLSSCGLETVDTLPAPDINFLDLTLVTNTTLSLNHVSSRYSGTDFQGYQVYYKVYPGTTTNFSRLTADRDSVALSPTVNQLINLGYFQMTQSAQNGPIPPALSGPLTPTLIKPTGDTQITLDFSGYSSKPTLPSASQPMLEYSGLISSVSKPYLYRTSLLAGSITESFLTLTTWGTAPAAVDMAGTNASSQYEINVFVVAYGLTSTLQAIYSQPMPWGVIRSPN